MLQHLARILIEKRLWSSTRMQRGSKAVLHLLYSSLINEEYVMTFCIVFVSHLILFLFFSRLWVCWWVFFWLLKNTQKLLKILLETHGPAQEMLLDVPPEEHAWENEQERFLLPLPITSLISLCGFCLWLSEDASTPPAAAHKREPAR